MGLPGISSWTSLKDDPQEGEDIGGQNGSSAPPLHLDSAKPPGLSLSSVIGLSGGLLRREEVLDLSPYLSFQNPPLLLQGFLPFLVKSTLYSTNYHYWQPLLKLGME